MVGLEWPRPAGQGMHDVLDTAAVPDTAAADTVVAGGRKLAVHCWEMLPDRKTDTVARHTECRRDCFARRVAPESPPAVGWAPCRHHHTRQKPCSGVSGDEVAGRPSAVRSRADLGWDSGFGTFAGTRWRVQRQGSEDPEPVAARPPLRLVDGSQRQRQQQRRRHCCYSMNLSSPVGRVMVVGRRQRHEGQVARCTQVGRVIATSEARELEAVLWTASESAVAELSVASTYDIAEPAPGPVVVALLLVAELQPRPTPDVPGVEGCPCSAKPLRTCVVAADYAPQSLLLPPFGFGISRGPDTSAHILCPSQKAETLTHPRTLVP